MERLRIQQGPEAGKRLQPEQYLANNLAVFGEVKRRNELTPGNPERLNLSPVALRALELYSTEISLIPRGPGDKLGMMGYFSAYTDQFNTNPEMQQKLSFRIDKAGNVNMHLAAYGGEPFEAMPAIHMQGHYDMVSDANVGFLEPSVAGVALQLKEIPDKKTGKPILWMSGIETSSGIDCAWALSWGMAYLEHVSRENKAHPDLNLDATSDEEPGLLGAKAFSFTREQLLGDKPLPKEWYLLNIDNSRLNGIVGDAGLTGSKVTLETPREPSMPEGFTHLSLGLFGTQGGHSGDERDRIGNGRWNKITEATEMFRQLKDIEGLEDIRLVAMDGGHAHNGIPIDVRNLVLAVPEGKEDEILSQIQEMVTVKNAQAVVDLKRFSEEHPDIAEDDEVDVLTVRRVEERKETQNMPPMTSAATNKTLALLDTLNPDGVLGIEWSPNDPEAIETSSNLSVIHTTDEGIQITIMSRSSQNEQLGDDGIRATAIRNVLNEFDATTTFIPELIGYPWQPDFSDPIVEIEEKAAAKALPSDKKFKTTTIHAGVEIKILRDKLWELFGPDFILHAASNGPQYKGEHGPNERAPIASMGDFDALESAVIDGIIEYELGKQENTHRRMLAA